MPLQKSGFFRDDSVSITPKLHHIDHRLTLEINTVLMLMRGYKILWHLLPATESTNLVGIDYLLLERVNANLE